MTPLETDLATDLATDLETDLATGLETDLEEKTLEPDDLWDAPSETWWEPVEVERSAFLSAMDVPRPVCPIQVGFRVLTLLMRPYDASMSMSIREHAESWLKMHAWGPTDDPVSHAYIVRCMRRLLSQE